MITRETMGWLLGRIAALRSEDRGQVAVGWLALGVLIGVVLVVFAIIKFLIPGE